MWKHSIEPFVYFVVVEETDEHLIPKFCSLLQYSNYVIVDLDRDDSCNTLEWVAECLKVSKLRQCYLNQDKYD